MRRPTGWTERAWWEDLATSSEIEAWFQPIVDRAGRVDAVEALARWRRGDEVRGADEFIPAAERSRSVLPMTLVVLAESLALAGAVDPRVRVHVNVSQTLLDDGRMQESVAAGCTAMDVPPERLCLEVTETAVVEDLDRAVLRLDELRSLGCSVALDDFGTGYGSLVLLRSGVVDCVKIDRTFVAEIVDRPVDQAIVEAVTTMAHAVGATVVAEGVDDETARELVFALGSDGAQGHLFGEAVPVGGLGRLVADPNE